MDVENSILSRTSRDVLVREHLGEMEFHLALLDNEEPADLSNAIKLSIETIPVLGVALASLPESARTMLSSTAVPKLLVATDKYGNQIDPSILHMTDGGRIGSYGIGKSGIRQARFHEVVLGNATSVTTIPYDPTLLFMSAALAQINQKLDSIQSTVDEILEWMQQEKRAEMRGSLKILADLLNGYSHNYGNSTWMTTAHSKVFDIKQEAQQNAEFYHARIIKIIGKKAFIETRNMVSKRSHSILSDLKDYQTALYMYSFASFLDPVLSSNFDSAYLQTALQHIEESTNRYRALYTRCYNAIATNVLDAVDTVAFEKLAHASKKLGDIVEKTPVPNRLPIDKGLEKLGDDVESYNDDQNTELLEKLRSAKTIDVSVFEQNLKVIDLLHNQPTLMACDTHDVYILPSPSLTAE